MPEKIWDRERGNSTSANGSPILVLSCWVRIPIFASHRENERPLGIAIDVPRICKRATCLFRAGKSSRKNVSARLNQVSRGRTGCVYARSYASTCTCVRICACMRGTTREMIKGKGMKVRLLIPRDVSRSATPLYGDLFLH